MVCLRQDNSTGRQLHVLYFSDIVLLLVAATEPKRYSSHICPDAQTRSNYAFLEFWQRTFCIGARKGEKNKLLDG